MPRTDPTFMRDRIANTWLRSIGVPAICAASARLDVNGSYYGLFVVEERVGKHFVKEFFPGNSGGDLFKEGLDRGDQQGEDQHPEAGGLLGCDHARGAVCGGGPPRSVLTWAAEALLNDADGTYGGDHNFLIYDQGRPKITCFSLMIWTRRWTTSSASTAIRCSGGHRAAGGS